MFVYNAFSLDFSMFLGTIRHIFSSIIKFMFRHEVRLIAHVNYCSGMFRHRRLFNRLGVRVAFGENGWSQVGTLKWFKHCRKSVDDNYQHV